MTINSNEKEKIFLIQPMSGRSECKTKRERQMWDKLLKELGYELIDTYYTENPPENEDARLYYLGKSIQDMAKADYVICAPGWKKHTGCKLEHKIAKAYKKDIIKIKLVK